MTIPDILEYVQSHPSGRVKLAVADIDGILRGKYISKEKFIPVSEGRMGFCDVAFGWDAADLAYDNARYTGWHTGYPDALVKLDLPSFRKIPWENDIPFFIGDFINEKEEAAYVCPRQLLKKIVSQCDEMGYVPQFSQEFEWFNFAETPATLQQNPTHAPAYHPSAGWNPRV